MDKIECICFGYACVGFSNLQLNKLPEAIKALQESVRRSEISGAKPVENLARSGLALAEFFSGRTEAVQDMENVLRTAKDTDNPYTAAFVSSSLGDRYTELGELDRAESYFEDALEYYRRNNMRPYIAHTLQSVASLYDKQGRTSDADRARSEASGLAEALQAPA